MILTSCGSVEGGGKELSEFIAMLDASVYIVGGELLVHF